METKLLGEQGSEVGSKVNRKRSTWATLMMVVSVDTQISEVL